MPSEVFELYIFSRCSRFPNTCTSKSLTLSRCKSLLTPISISDISYYSLYLTILISKLDGLLKTLKPQGSIYE